MPSGQYLSYPGQTSTMLSSYGSSRDSHSPFRSQSPIFLPKPRHLTHRVTLRNPLNTATWWHIVEDNSKTIDRGQTKFTTHNLQWCVNIENSQVCEATPLHSTSSLYWILTNRAANISKITVLFPKGSAKRAVFILSWSNLDHVVELWFLSRFALAF